MKKPTLSIMLLSVIAVIGIGLFWKYGKAQAVGIKLHVKDLPEHGLSIVAPSDPSFEALMSAFQKAHPGAPVDALKLFSVFIKHRGTRSVVAYKIRWECVNAAGQIIYKDKFYSAAWHLTDEAAENKQDDSDTIKPDSTWLFSVLSEPQLLDSQSAGDQDGGSWSVVIPGKNESRPQQASSEAEVVELLNAELARYTNITVVLDGVFFNDGSFAGPNTTGFFEAVKAEIDARRDLLLEIKRRANNKQSADEIFKHLEEIAVGQGVDLGFNSNASDYYNYHKKIVAGEFVKLAKNLDKSQALQHLIKKLDKPWGNLRKL